MTGLVSSFDAFDAEVEVVAAACEFVVGIENSILDGEWKDAVPAIDELAVATYDEVSTEFPWAVDIIGEDAVREICGRVASTFEYV